MPITERTYEAAARHCRSKKVIRMRAGVRNDFDVVVGIVDPKTGRPIGDRDIARIECVRKYLGIAKSDLEIVYD